MKSVKFELTPCLGPRDSNCLFFLVFRMIKCSNTCFRPTNIDDSQMKISPAHQANPDVEI